MDKHEDTPTPAPDTEHMASQVVVPKKSHKTLYTVFAVIVALIVVALIGLYVYKVKVLDPQAAKEAAMASPSPSAKPKTDEEKMTAALTDGVQKQIDALKQEDDSKYIKDSSAAASNVGGNLHEQDLHD